MERFPFTPEEWERVREASHAVMNATLCDDEPLRASLYLEMRAVLAGLRERYGEHPVLLETEADFEADLTRRIRLYNTALDIATQKRLPTLTVRLSLARVLAENIGDLRAALDNLLLCQSELQNEADDSERAEWVELQGLCNELMRKAAAANADRTK